MLLRQGLISLLDTLLGRGLPLPHLQPARVERRIHHERFGVERRLEIRTGEESLAARLLIADHPAPEGATAAKAGRNPIGLIGMLHLPAKQARPVHTAQAIPKAVLLRIPIGLGIPAGLKDPGKNALRIPFASRVSPVIRLPSLERLLFLLFGHMASS